MNKQLPKNEQDECELLVQYLISRSPTSRLCTAYHLALQKIIIDFSTTEKKLWLACLQNKWLLQYVDAYLAYRQPSHPIRQRVFVMLALLETQPDYHEYFLPARGSYFQLLIILLKSIHSILKIGIGRILIWII